MSGDKGSTYYIVIKGSCECMVPSMTTLNLSNLELYQYLLNNKRNIDLDDPANLKNDIVQSV